MTTEASSGRVAAPGHNGDATHGHTSLAHAEHPERFLSHPALAERVRHDVGASLQATLVDLLDLSLVAKQLHWTVTGSTSGTIREQLDELSGDWRSLADTVAERQAAIGVMPDGQAAAVAARPGQHAIPVEPLTHVGATRELTAHLSFAVAELRDRVTRTGEQDVISQHVLIEVGRNLEHHLWKVRANGS
jgi:starvation-inducible DNA-binding protein